MENQRKVAPRALEVLLLHVHLLHEVAHAGREGPRCRELPVAQRQLLVVGDGGRLLRTGPPGYRRASAEAIVRNIEQVSNARDPRCIVHVVRGALGPV